MPRKKRTELESVSAKADAVTKITPEEMSAVNDILSMVNMDIGNAEIGKMFALRAGVGLLVIKDMYPRGDWGPVVASAIPNRSARTIRRYMADAKTFIDSRSLKPHDVWAGLRDFDPTALTQGEGGLLLTAGNDSDGESADVPDVAQQMADYINGQADARSKDNEPGKKPSRKLTKAQRRDAAAGSLVMAVSKVNVAVSGSDWALVDTETLDTVASALTVAVAQIREELKKRG